MATGTKAEHIRIGKFISELREQRGITQRELAQELGTSQSAVARMEAGQQNFTTEMLTKISGALNREIVSIGSGALNLQIEGGHKLHGEVTINRAKNCVMPVMCAALLNKNKTVIKGIPKIEEVNRMAEVLISIGVQVRWVGAADLEITPPAKLDMASIDVEAAIKTRSVLMLLGPLIHLMDDFELPHPGGCNLGARTVRPHLYAMEDMGVDIESLTHTYRVTRDKLKPAYVIMYETSDTATENALMAAARIPGKTTIKAASYNYMVRDLCVYLTQLGVRIEGIGTSTLVVHGKRDLNKRVVFHPSEDPIESMLFITAAAVTKSNLTIKRVPIEFQEIELLKLHKMGLKFRLGEPYKSRNGYTLLADLEIFPSELKALEEKIHPAIFPGINMDNLPFFAPIATQAHGTTLLHDWPFENRSIYFTELNKLRADVTLLDPHRLLIKGPTKLKAAEVVCPPALRPAAIILLAMLAAEGTSILRNVYSINRGYEDLFERLNKLGARISPLTSL